MTTLEWRAGRIGPRKQVCTQEYDKGYRPGREPGNMNPTIVQPYAFALLNVTSDAFRPARQREVMTHQINGYYLAFPQIEENSIASLPRQRKKKSYNPFVDKTSKGLHICSSLILKKHD